MKMMKTFSKDIMQMDLRNEIYDVLERFKIISDDELMVLFKV